MTTNLFEYNSENFRTYLHSDAECVFTLDLSEATMLEVINEYTKVKSLLSPNFAKQYSGLTHNLKAIQSEFGCTIMPIQITDIFWHNFCAFLVNKGLAPSTIKTFCSQLVTAVQWGARHKAPISMTYDFFKIPMFYRQQLALSQDDVSRIYHFDIDKIPRRSQYLRHMHRVRDMFVLSCNLGQRYSDMRRINKTHFDRNIFTIVQQKTGNTARVDIDKFALDSRTVYNILEKYDYAAPFSLDISNYNKYVKQLMQYMGFNEVVTREEKIAGRVVTQSMQKHKLITSHTARRTFATVNVMRGYRYVDVRRATGHKSESGFEKYICYGID